MANESINILYTRPDCTYSDALRFDLDQSGTRYKEIDLSIAPDQIPVLEGLTGGERITPVLVQNGDVIVGYHGLG